MLLLTVLLTVLVYTMSQYSTAAAVTVVVLAEP
jgi:hypothetical protein